MSESSFLKALKECLHAVFYYPRSPRHRPGVPLGEREPDRTTLKDPKGDLTDYQIVGNPGIHLANVLRVLTADCHRRFFTEPKLDGMEGIHKANIDLSVYVERTNLQEDLALRVRQGGYFKIIGVTGSGKSTLLYWLMNELSPERRFIYVNLADNSLQVYGDTALQSKEYSTQRPKGLMLAKFRSNLCRLIASLSDGAVKVDENLDPGTFALEMMRTYSAENATLIFDDVDALPLMLQETVVQFAIDLCRQGLSTCVAIRTSGVKRLILEGYYADYSTRVVIPVTPDRDAANFWETKPIINDLTASQLIDVYNRRLEVLTDSVETNAFFRYQHASSFNHFLRSNLATLRQVPATHWAFLVNECDLFNCCNRSIRMAVDTVASMFAEILTDTHPNIDATRFLTRSGDTKIHSALRDLLLERVLSSGNTQITFPRLYQKHNGSTSTCFGIRALEILGLNDGLTMRTWIEYVNFFFPTLREEVVRGGLLELCSRIAGSDPICVYQGSEGLDGRVSLMPAGRYYCTTLSSTVEYLSRAGKSAGESVRPPDDHRDRVDRAISILRDLIEEWQPEDHKLLAGCGFDGSWAEDIRAHHYCDRALRGVRAFINSGFGLNQAERDAALQDVAELSILSESNFSSVVS